jgi:hypothetical protein
MRWALLRTDVALKSSGGDQRLLLERLVVELCARPDATAERGDGAGPPGRPAWRGAGGRERLALGLALASRALRRDL